MQISPPNHDSVCGMDGIQRDTGIVGCVIEYSLWPWRVAVPHHSILHGGSARGAVWYNLHKQTIFS